MDSKIFKTIDGKLELVIKSRKSAIIFELNDSYKDTYNFKFVFDDKTFLEIYKYLLEIINKCWNNVDIREAYSFASDYTEYYDPKLDNNGSLRLAEDIFFIEKPSKDSNKLFQFNKTKIGTFLYDYKKILERR